MNRVIRYVLRHEHFQKNHDCRRWPSLLSDLDGAWVLTLPHPNHVSHNYAQEGNDLSYLRGAENICSCIIRSLFLLSLLLADSLRLSVREQASDEDDDLQDEVHCCCKRRFS